MTTYSLFNVFCFWSILVLLSFCNNASPFSLMNFTSNYVSDWNLSLMSQIKLMRLLFPIYFQMTHLLFAYFAPSRYSLFTVRIFLFSIINFLSSDVTTWNVSLKLLLFLLKDYVAALVPEKLFSGYCLMIFLCIVIPFYVILLFNFP